MSKPIKMKTYKEFDESKCTHTINKNILTQYKHHERPTLGISAKDTSIPIIKRNVNILDVGAGSGIITERIIRYNPTCSVSAIEPGDKYHECAKRIGFDNVANLTLQQALLVNPEKYYQAFDVVFVFKYNVNFLEKDEFVKALSEVVKPDGIVYVTSVEYERFYYNKNYEALYLNNTFNKYFDNITLEPRRTITKFEPHIVYEHDLLMTLKSPKIEPEIKKHRNCSIV